MARPNVIRLKSAAILVAVLAVAAACAATPGPTADVRPVARMVEMYVTTGDRAKLLHREPDLRWTADTGGPAIDVDERAEYQEMVGFGAALTDASAWLIAHRLSPEARAALLRELYGGEPGLGFGFLRLDMGASDFSLRHYSYDDMPAGQRDPTLAHFSIDADRAETIPILQDIRGINPRVTIMASPWSAPAWMKTTDSMIKGTLRDDAYDAFALYFLAFVRAYEASGVPIYAVTVQNEPHFEPENYPGMRLTPADRARFIGRHLGPLLARAGVSTRILEWDHNWDEPGAPLAVLSDTLARRYVAGVAWHCYGGDVSAQSAVHDAYPDKDVFFTECSGGDWAPRFADNLLWTTQHLVIGATRNWARGVLMWNLALDEHHGPHTGGCGNCRGVVTIDSATGAVTRNEEYYALGHASRFVRPGAHRIESTARAGTLETVAFRNPDGSIALIAANPDTSATTIRVRHGRRAFAATLAARSVATFRWH